MSDAPLLESGWLKRQCDIAAAATDKWPAWMREAAGLKTIPKTDSAATTFHKRVGRATFERLVLRLANQGPVRYYLHLNGQPDQRPSWIRR